MPDGASLDKVWRSLHQPYELSIAGKSGATIHQLSGWTGTARSGGGDMRRVAPLETMHPQQIYLPENDVSVPTRPYEEDQKLGYSLQSGPVAGGQRIFGLDTGEDGPRPCLLLYRTQAGACLPLLLVAAFSHRLILAWTEKQTSACEYTTSKLQPASPTFYSLQLEQTESSVLAVPESCKHGQF